MSEDAPKQTKQVTLASTAVVTFDPDGAVRNLDLPAEADCTGIVLYINNAGVVTEIITIRDDAAATICTPDGAESAVVWCDGVSWRGLVGVAS